MWFIVFVVKKATQSNRTIRMPDDLISRLNEIAQAKDVSFNRLIVQCCLYALENMQKEDKQKAQEE